MFTEEDISVSEEESKQFSSARLLNDETTWNSALRHVSQLKHVVISGIGFFSDAYDLFIINIVLAILTAEMEGFGDSDQSAVSTAALAGAILGQLAFGFIADKIGRKKGFVVTLSIVIVGAILSASSFSIPSIGLTVAMTLAGFRFLLGIGIGGEYPLSATITAESSNASNRGRMVAAVFSMQGLGSLAAAFVGFLLLHVVDNVDLVWRLCLGLGAIPGLLSLYHRITMHETESFSRASRNSASQPRQTFSRIATRWAKLLR
jgi:PHS family inorganic phosphate transporter-like MFS transporter